MNRIAVQLRAATGYPWQDCIEASRRTDDLELAREMLPAISRQRLGIEYRGETTR